jgi:hypothetical protein
MRSLGIRAIGALFALSLAGHGSAAVPPEPSGPHPRLFHEPGTTEALRASAGVRGSATARAVANCRRIAGSPAEYARDGYMGLDWARSLQTCLVAWRATGEDRHADTALVYFRALLDDRTTIGDGKGGDESARRDSGYAIRALGPYTAIAYDWLHARIDEPLRARARQRFAAWTRWYTRHGYRAHDPGNNYHAGYVAAATLIAVAQGGEAGEDGARLWREVVERTFGAELLPAARDGVLAGGDWGEGWQYGPLSVANYAMAARAIAPHGIDVASMGRWLEEVFVRHAHALTPTGNRTLVVGDTQSESPHIVVRRETLESVVFGPAPERAREWARAELERSGDFADDDLGYLLFGALAESMPGASVPFPRERLPGAWFSRGTSILYARTRWDERAAWFAAFCSPTIDVDHLPANAGNFVLSRGADHGIVDPSPYGSLSSLTSNAPGIEAPDQPQGYTPSQSYWSVETGFAWKRRLADGALFARCDYADQWRFREVASPIRTAWRDFVFLPWPVDGAADGATLLVIDRARTREPGHGLHLRFRTKGDLEQTGAGGSARIGDSRLSILRLSASGGEVEVRALPKGDCFGEGTTRGGCDASRFSAHEARTVVPGTEARAAFEIDLGPKGSSTAMPKAESLVAEGGSAWQLARGERRFVVAAADAASGLRYAVPAAPALHVALPGTVGGSASVRVAATRVLDDCRVVVGASEGTSLPGAPALFTLDADCTVRPAPTQEVPQDVSTLLGESPSAKR